MSTSISLKAEFIAGTDIKTACFDLCMLSDKLNSHLEASFNGTKLNAYPGDNPLGLYKAYCDRKPNATWVSARGP